MIRKLEKSDYKEYLNLISLFRNTYFSIKEFNKVLDEITQFTEIWIFSENNKICGSATLLLEKKFIHNISKVGHIEDVIVLDKYRGRV